jgi:DNA-binding response OmpR family regulator
MRGKKVLVIDDDLDNLKLNDLIFTKAGAQVFMAKNGKEGLQLLGEEQPDIIILDLMLPDMDGFEVCEKIRKVSDVPIIMLTGLKRESDVLRGLQVGADDYLVKPFSPQILVARAKSILRRSERRFNVDGYEYNDGHLSIDLAARHVHVDGADVPLTPIEFRILAYLLGHAGQTVTHNQILETVWGPEYEGFKDYVHVSVSTLRHKLGDNQKGEDGYIVTVPRVGYYFKKR